MLKCQYYFPPSPFRTVHPASWGHPGPSAEAGWTPGSQVPQQEPGRDSRHQAHLQPHHQAQHRACALCGNWWVPCSVVKKLKAIWVIRVLSCNFVHMRWQNGSGPTYLIGPSRYAEEGPLKHLTHSLWDSQWYGIVTTSLLAYQQVA